MAPEITVNSTKFIDMADWWIEFAECPYENLVSDTSVTVKLSRPGRFAGIAIIFSNDAGNTGSGLLPWQQKAYNDTTMVEYGDEILSIAIGSAGTEGVTGAKSQVVIFMKR